MHVVITESTYQSILSQALRDAPIESCGYLLGTDKETATENYPMTKIVGNWHSHPASPSRPSQEDLRLAFDPSILYFILSLAGEQPVLNAFRIEKGEVKEKFMLR